MSNQGENDPNRNFSWLKNYYPYYRVPVSKELLTVTRTMNILLKITWYTVLYNNVLPSETPGRVIDIGKNHLLFNYPRDSVN